MKKATLFGWILIVLMAISNLSHSQKSATVEEYDLNKKLDSTTLVKFKPYIEYLKNDKYLIENGLFNEIIKKKLSAFSGVAYSSGQGTQSCLILDDKSATILKKLNSKSNKISGVNLLGTFEMNNDKVVPILKPNFYEGTFKIGGTYNYFPNKNSISYSGEDRKYDLKGYLKAILVNRIVNSNQFKMKIKEDLNKLIEIYDEYCHTENKQPKDKLAKFSYDRFKEYNKIVSSYTGFFSNNDISKLSRKEYKIIDSLKDPKKMDAWVDSIYYKQTFAELDSVQMNAPVTGIKLFWFSAGLTMNFDHQTYFDKAKWEKAKPEFGDHLRIYPVLTITANRATEGFFEKNNREVYGFFSGKLSLSYLSKYNEDNQVHIFKNVPVIINGDSILSLQDKKVYSQKTKNASLVLDMSVAYNYFNQTKGLGYTTQLGYKNFRFEEAYCKLGILKRLNKPDNSPIVFEPYLLFTQNLMEGSLNEDAKTPFGKRISLGINFNIALPQLTNTIRSIGLR